MKRKHLIPTGKIKMLWWRENWSRCRAIGIEDILELYGISSGKSGAHEEQDIVNLIENWLTNAYPNSNDTERVGTRYYTFDDSELLTEIMLAAAEREQTVIVEFILAQEAKFHPSKSLETNLSLYSWDSSDSLDSLDSGREKRGLSRNISEEDPKVIEVLLQGGIRPSKSLLLQATKEGNLPVLKKLVENGGDINATYDNDSDGKQLIHHAAKENQLEIMKYLIVRGANINSYHYYFHTPLNYAISNDNKSMVDLLLKAGADPNIGYLPAVHRAASNNNAPMLAHLCDYHGLDAEQVDRQGGRPIHSACSFSLYGDDCLRFLIDRGVNVNAQDKWGRTPLHSIGVYIYGDELKMLLEAGADIDLAANNGETPFQSIGHYVHRYADERADAYPVLATHIAKKLTAGLYVSAENHQKFQSDLRCLNNIPKCQRVFEDIEAAKGGWEEEIELMKRSKIHGPLTVYNLLASRNALAYSKDPSFMHALETFDYDQFPHYQSIIKGKINEEKNKPGLLSRL